jgi:hypothetical protein
MIYDGPPSKQLPALTALILSELRANRRCLYLNSPTMVAGLRSYLAAAGLDVEAEVRKGALVLSSDQAEPINGRFDVDGMLEMLADAVNQALADGYDGLFATGDMTWEFGRGDDLATLLEYECRLEKLFRTLPGLSGICQYHRDTLPPDTIQTAIHTHQGVFINETLSRVNPYYVPPEALEFSAPGLTAEQVEGILLRLRHHAGA